MRTTKPASIAATTLMAFSTPPLPTPPISLPLAKPAILCLHGRQQNAATFALKISGARKKLSRMYECDFLDAPLPILSSHSENGRAWWEKDEAGRIVGLEEAFDHIRQRVRQRRDEGKSEYCAILGFSQGGTLAASLAVAGIVDIVPKVEAVITAGSPMVEEVMEYASSFRRSISEAPISNIECPVIVPMLHFAGETDAMVSVESTMKLCKAAGSGEVKVHDRGHMFPTRAADVRVILEFLGHHVDHSELY